MVKRNVVQRRIDLSVEGVTSGIDIGECIVRSAIACVTRRGSLEEASCKLVLLDRGAKQEGCGKDRTIIGVVKE